MKHILLRFLVWNMRFATRYLGFLARPIVRIYAVNEVIACGVRELAGSVSVLFTPDSSHRDHKAFLLKDRQWGKALSCRGVNYSDPYVQRTLLPEAKIGERYKMKAVTRSGRSISSPSITVKQETIYKASLLEARMLSKGEIFFSWKRAEVYNPMIYFLVIEDKERKTSAAIYTREHFWTYPKIKEASYSVGPPDPPMLVPGGEYTAKLAVVDFDGWVSHITELQFGL